MAETITVNTLTDKARALQSYWQTRDARFKNWYNMIQLQDELAQENMESFVSSDPRSSYNLLLHMLNSSRIPHRIMPEFVTPDLVVPAGNLSKLLDTAWADVHKRYRLSGHASWMRDMVGLMLATGWYSVFATVAQSGQYCIAEIWNPGTVYPMWDDQLSEVAHITTMSAAAIRRMAARNKWEVNARDGRVFDYWWIGDDGKVYNSVAIENALVKPATLESKFSRIPIFVSPVGGLPDTGILAQSPETWKGEIGQSSVTTAEPVYRSMNKWWTFSMQLLRDTAQSRWYEKSAGGKPILKKEDLYKRGFIARLGPNDEIGPLPVPPIPVEMRAMQIDMEAMLQRAGPPWSLFGGGAQGMTSYAMSQVASGAAQMAQPFHQGVIDVLSDIDNFWLEQIRTHGYEPHGLQYPRELTEDLQVTASYDIRIPGDIIQRATVARMLNPKFELSQTRVMEELFPEIKNPIEEQVQSRKDDAMANPIMGTIDLVIALRNEANTIRKAGQTPETAGLYEKAADSIEAQLGGQPQQRPGTSPPEQLPPGPRPEVQPNREQSLNPAETVQ
jgi:hypothetical protein